MNIFIPPSPLPSPPLPLTPPLPADWFKGILSVFINNVLFFAMSNKQRYTCIIYVIEQYNSI
jgi:hypothetical protein